MEDKQKMSFKKIFDKEMRVFMDYVEEHCKKSVDNAYAINIAMKTALRKTHVFKEESLHDEALRLMKVMDKVNLFKLKNRISIIPTYREVVTLVTRSKEDTTHVYAIGYNTILWIREEVNKRINKNISSCV